MVGTEKISSWNQLLEFIKKRIGKLQEQQETEKKVDRNESAH